MSTLSNNSKKKKNKSVVRNQYSFDFRLRAVKLYLEESYPATLIHQETGLSTGVLYRWAKIYKTEGENGLRQIGARPGGSSKTHQAVKDKIVEIKQKTPGAGKKRISQMLRRLFFLPASPNTVQNTLKEEGLENKPERKKPKRNMTRPRFFERSTPNQLWQTDIFTFRLGGKYAYLIGYIDDYSRYMVGLELFMSQKADQVIELYRRATSEYAVPKEMLTDNGRQYTNWRGTTRFEKELKKDRVHHIKSSPHHPMTLGKIERFWKTIFQEFLSRAQFSSFEEARERLKLWVQYYNHKRPHQGIGGLCPADRYYEIRHAVKKTIEEGIKENILEMALRGKPKPPFYMVGRMEGQSVVLRAEKGKLKLSVDGQQQSGDAEMVYNLESKDNINEGNTHGKDDKTEENSESTTPRSETEGPSRAVGLDREAKERRCVPGTEHTLECAVPVAKQSHGGDAPGAGTQSEPGTGHGVESPSFTDAGEKSLLSVGGGNDSLPATGEEAGNGIGTGKEREQNQIERTVHESGHTVAKTGQSDYAGSSRDDNSDRSGQTAGGLPEDLLRVGETSPERHGAGVTERTARQAGDPAGSGEGYFTENSGQTPEGPGCGQTNCGSSGYAESSQRADNRQCQ
jgi:transposase InsO family protein